VASRRRLRVSPRFCSCGEDGPRECSLSSGLRSDYRSKFSPPPEWYGWVPSVVSKTDVVPATFPMFLLIFSEDDLKTVVDLDNAP